MFVFVSYALLSGVEISGGGTPQSRPPVHEKAMGGLYKDIESKQTLTKTFIGFIWLDCTLYKGCRQHCNNYSLIFLLRVSQRLFRH